MFFCIFGGSFLFGWVVLVPVNAGYFGTPGEWVGTLLSGTKG